MDLDITGATTATVLMEENDGASTTLTDTAFLLGVPRKRLNLLIMEIERGTKMWPPPSMVSSCCCRYTN